MTGTRGLYFHMGVLFYVDLGIEGSQIYRVPLSTWHRVWKSQTGTLQHLRCTLLVLIKHSTTWQLTRVSTVVMTAKRNCTTYFFLQLKLRYGVHERRTATKESAANEVVLLGQSVLWAWRFLTTHSYLKEVSKWGSQHHHVSRFYNFRKHGKRVGSFSSRI